MDLTGSVITLIAYNGDVNLPLFYCAGTTIGSGVDGKGSVTIQPDDTKGKVGFSGRRPWQGDYLIDVVRNDTTSVQVAGRITIRPRPFVAAEAA